VTKIPHNMIAFKDSFQKFVFVTQIVNVSLLSFTEIFV